MDENEKTLPLIDRTIDRLVQYIAEEGLGDGDRLPTERALAETLQVGRSTLREALRALISRNVLEARRGVGTFVSYKQGVADDPLGFRLIRDKEKLAMDLVEFRLLIEPRTAAWAAQYATAAEIAELEHLCIAVEERIRKGEPYMEKDREFHTRLARCSRNLIMPKLLPIIHGAIGLFISETKGALRDETIKTHRAILNAVKAHDGGAAYDAMLLHLVYNRNLLRP